jgi:hypothetical protein
LSWNLSLLKRETQNSYTTTAFSEDIPGTLGPFKCDLDRTDLINNFNEILPLIVQSSVRFRSILKLPDKPEDTINKAAEIGHSLFSSLSQEIRNIINSSKSLHIFTDDWELPWALLLDGTDFVSLKNSIFLLLANQHLKLIN